MSSESLLFSNGRNKAHVGCVSVDMSYVATMTLGGWGTATFRQGVVPALRGSQDPRTGALRLQCATSGAAALQVPRVSGREAISGDRTEDRRLELDWQLVVKRCLDGDSLAWTELVKAHHRRVYGLCYRFTGSTHDAEDLTQDVFLKIYGNLASFDLNRGSIQTWITTLTRNLLVDHFRRSRQQRVTDSIDAGWDDSEEQKMSDKLSDTRPTPLDRAAAKEIEKMVQQALTKISPELREAVILRDLQDLDYKEIAQVLRIPEGTVKSRISRGRAELARLLERNKKQVV